jgi:outer membrane protein OmpA-like peptidoglycan-associated protein
MDDVIEAYFSAGGGYYKHLSGVVDDEGGGWFIGGGLNYQLGNGNLVGLFARRDQAEMRPIKGPNSEDTTYFTGGLSFTHLFLAEEAAPPPPPPAPVPAAAPPAKKKIVLRGVNFDFDKANIRADAKPILDEAVNTLKESSDVNISVEGHTDAVGSNAYNQKLSERRAKAVTDYLADHGISRARLSTAGFGESRPVATNDTAAGRAENRRVELKVSGE